MNPFLFRLFRANETKVHELNYLFWECTTRCMLRCRHCGSDCSVQSREKDMPLEDFLKALDTIPADHRPKDFVVIFVSFWSRHNMAFKLYFFQSSKIILRHHSFK